MDFVDEENIAAFQRREESGEISGLFNRRAAGVLDIHAHGVREDVGQGGLAQTGRAAEQDVLENIAPLLRRLNHQFEPLTNTLLALELAEQRRTQREIEGGLRSFESCLMKIFCHKRCTFRCLVLNSIKCRRVKSNKSGQPVANACLE